MQAFIMAVGELFKDLPYVMQYIDDIVITSEMEEEHFKHVDTVLKRLDESGLTLNKQKCEFFKRELVFLSYQVDGIGIRPDMEKVAALVHAEPPKIPREVRAFLGGCNYFAKHILRYAEFAALLTPLTRKKKDPTFEWKEEHDLAFSQIKEGLKLMIYNEHTISNKPIHIVFSVRDKAYSAPIMQEDITEPNKFRSLAFVGKILLDVQRRYLPPELSFTCMGDVLKRYAYMLLGKEVHLYTNEY